MNKRILELAKQVWPDPNISHVNHMKFAKLIIQECCDIITPYNIKNGVMFDISTNLPPIYVIKKHFGVE